MVLTDLNWRHLAAGITAGAVSTAALYPLDLVKTRFQVADSRALLSVERYRSLMNAFSTIVRSDGPLALYQGMTPALVGASASWGLYFWFYESAKARRRREQELTGGRLSAWSHMVCGWQAGTITCFFTNPVWLIKTRLQLQQAKHPDAAGNYRGMLGAGHARARARARCVGRRGLTPEVLRRGTAYCYGGGCAGAVQGHHPSAVPGVAWQHPGAARMRMGVQGALSPAPRPSLLHMKS